ncbi:hypothetical protein [Roseovarius ramblicola]|uniref:Uncharacterized protein n=1 Tax=Roseovarius ramblicola TaxID=2022336 RepID=A0ABV5I2N1_9RHOB
MKFRLVSCLVLAITFPALLVAQTLEDHRRVGDGTYFADQKVNLHLARSIAESAGYELVSYMVCVGREECGRVMPVARPWRAQSRLGPEITVLNLKVADGEPGDLVYEVADLPCLDRETGLRVNGRLQGLQGETNTRALACFGNWVALSRSRHHTIVSANPDGWETVRTAVLEEWNGKTWQPTRSYFSREYREGLWVRSDGWYQGDEMRVLDEDGETLFEDESRYRAVADTASTTVSTADKCAARSAAVASWPTYLGTVVSEACRVSSQVFASGVSGGSFGKFGAEIDVEFPDVCGMYDTLGTATGELIETQLLADCLLSPETFFPPEGATGEAPDSLPEYLVEVEEDAVSEYGQWLDSLIEDLDTSSCESRVEEVSYPQGNLTCTVTVKVVCSEGADGSCDCAATEPSEPECKAPG